MSDTDSDIPNLIDRSVKRLFRDQPQAVLRLAGVEAATVRFEDSNLNIPELRADHVLIVEEEGEPTPYALYLEYQQELMMIDAMENLKELFLETGKLQMWLQDPRLSGEVRDAGRAEGLAEGRAEGRAEGKAEGEAAGRAEGESEAVRRMTLALLTRRFGDVPEALQAQIATADADWCQDLFDRAITAASLSELTDNRS
jgi:flagellar biosynthesis/type III secretory pathway protein FliH